MFCDQLKVYLGYLVVQLILSLFLFGNQKIRFGVVDLLGPLLFSCAVYYLCENKHYVVANVMVGLVLVLGLGLDLKLSLL